MASATEESFRKRFERIFKGAFSSNVDWKAALELLGECARECPEAFEPLPERTVFEAPMKGRCKIPRDAATLAVKIRCLDHEKSLSLLRALKTVTPEAWWKEVLRQFVSYSAYDTALYDHLVALDDPLRHGDIGLSLGEYCASLVGCFQGNAPRVKGRRALPAWQQILTGCHKCESNPEPLSPHVTEEAVRRWFSSSDAYHSLFSDDHYLRLLRCVDRGLVLRGAAKADDGFRALDDLLRLEDKYHCFAPNEAEGVLDSAFCSQPLRAAERLTRRMLDSYRKIGNTYCRVFHNAASRALGLLDWDVSFPTRTGRIARELMGDPEAAKIKVDAKALAQRAWRELSWEASTIEGCQKALLEVVLSTDHPAVSSMASVPLNAVARVALDPTLDLPRRVVALNRLSVCSFFVPCLEPPLVPEAELGAYYSLLARSWRDLGRDGKLDYPRRNEIRRSLEALGLTYEFDAWLPRTFGAMTRPMEPRGDFFESYSRRCVRTDLGLLLFDRDSGWLCDDEGYGVWQFFDRRGDYDGIERVEAFGRWALLVGFCTFSLLSLSDGKVTSGFGENMNRLDGKKLSLQCVRAVGVMGWCEPESPDGLPLICALMFHREGISHATVDDRGVHETAFRPVSWHTKRYHVVCRRDDRVVLASEKVVEARNVWTLECEAVQARPTPSHSPSNTAGFGWVKDGVLYVYNPSEGIATTPFDPKDRESVDVEVSGRAALVYRLDRQGFRKDPAWVYRRRGSELVLCDDEKLSEGRLWAGDRVVALQEGGFAFVHAGRCYVIPNDGETVESFPLPSETEKLVPTGFRFGGKIVLVSKD